MNTRIEICAIVKNEARYIAEWLEYHFQLGIDHITLYDNGSEDELREVCNSFQRLSLVSWPERGNQQRTAYQHFLRAHRHLKIWVAFIDADEFIFDVESVGLKSMLAAVHEDVGGLEMPWIIFDSNNHDTRPSGLVLENYTTVHSIPPQENVKTICRVNSVDIDTFLSPHRFSYRPGFHAVELSVDKLPLCHYMLRSRDDVRLKVIRGDVWSPETESKRLANVSQAVDSILRKYDNGDKQELRMKNFAPTVKRLLTERGISIYEKP